MAEDGWAKFFPDTTHDGRQIQMGNRPDIISGDAPTYQSHDKPWANVSNAPFRLRAEDANTRGPFADPRRPTPSPPSRRIPASAGRRLDRSVLQRSVVQNGLARPLSTVPA